ncbi:MAG: HAMP domain-containing histidine kinase [Clostridiales bacterium]|jgi:signal transduction histidine kinase|nr:HAMP domain-containing histidine kinase [Clostridiales bacterium]
MNDDERNNIDTEPTAANDGGIKDEPCPPQAGIAENPKDGGIKRTVAFLPRQAGRFFRFVNSRFKIKVVTKMMLIYCGIYLVIGVAGAVLINYFITDSVVTAASGALDKYLEQAVGYGAAVSDAEAAELAAGGEILDAGLVITKLLGGSEIKIFDGAGGGEDLTANKKWNTYVQSGKRLYYACSRTVDGETLRYYMSCDMSARLNAVMSTQVLVFMAVPISLLLLGALGIAFSGEIMKPVRKITNTTKSITRETLSTRIDTSESQDEIRELAEVLNGMLANLEASFSAQDRFVSDASHELRTPLAVLAGYAQLLSRWGAADPSVLKESVDAINGEVDSMKSLIDRLLFLTRVSHGQPMRDDFFLNELVEEVVKETELACAGSHNVRMAEMEAFNLIADRNMLKQLIRILTENALKYTPSGGSVSFSCFRKEEQACVVIADTGIGIGHEDLPHVFERFYRADKVRTREGGGSGLGLSIAKKIIDAHGGEIVIESEPGEGTSAIILFPIVTADAD